MRGPPTLPAIGVLFAGVLFLAIWPAFGNKSLLISTAFFTLGLAIVLTAIGRTRRAIHAVPRGMTLRIVSLLVAASVGTSIAIGLSAHVLVTRLTIAEEAAACARFATISPNEAVARVMRAYGVDMLEFRTAVSPMAVNETGWLFYADCAAAPSFGESWGAAPWTADGRPHFLWFVGASEDWGLLAILA